MTRPLLLLAATLLFGACASGQVRRSVPPSAAASANTASGLDHRLDFANRSLRLIENGHLEQAVGELRVMARSAPEDALVRVLFARAAHEAGLYTEARTLAREALALDPMQPEVAWSVGWILSHNPAGVRFGRGMARDEALDALSIAREVNPADVATLDLMMRLLIHDPDGNFPSAGSNFDVAIALSEVLASNVADVAAGDFLTQLLWEAGRDAEILELKAPPGSDFARGIHLAARARAAGPAAAWTWIKEHVRGAQQQQQHMINAGVTLYMARDYAGAHQLLLEVNDPSAARLTTLVSKAVRRDATAYDPSQPMDVILEGLAHALHLSTRTDARSLNLQEPWLKAHRGGFPSVLSELGGTREPLLDAMRGAMTPKTLELPGVGVLVTLTSDFGDDLHLLERDGKHYRFHGIAEPEQQHAAAWQALVDGDTETARSWLRYWLTLAERHPDTQFPPELHTLIQGDRTALTQALALLSLPESDARTHLRYALEVLTPVWAKRNPKDALSRGLSQAYISYLSRDGQHDLALEANAQARIEGIYEWEDIALQERATLLFEAKRPKVLEREGHALLGRPAHREIGYEMLSLAARLRLDSAAFRDVHLKMVEEDLGDRLGNLNDAAWAALFLGAVTDEDIQRAELALGFTSDGDVSSLNTLAVLLAQRGDVDRAVAALAQLRGESKEPETESTVLYARGRIAETLGFTRAAKALYTSIRPQPDEDFGDVAPLAMKRLEVMAKKKEVPSSPAR